MEWGKLSLVWYGMMNFFNNVAVYYRRSISAMINDYAVCVNQVSLQ